MRKCAAVPVASAAASCQVPAFAFDPLDAAASQSDGKFSVASTVPESAAAQSAGAAPVRILMIADVPIVVSIASSRVLRTAVLSCSAMSKLRC
jgi:hypothetical protein